MNLENIRPHPAVTNLNGTHTDDVDDEDEDDDEEDADDDDDDDDDDSQAPLKARVARSNRRQRGLLAGTEASNEFARGIIPSVGI